MTIPGSVAAVLLLVIVVAIALSSFVLGLYVGERGRRKDAQRREGVLRVDEPEPAEVISPGRLTPEDAPSELAEAPEKFITDTMLETGCSREEAQLEWRTLVSRSLGDG